MNLSKESKDYINKFAKANKIDPSNAMQYAIVREVVFAIECGELNSPSDFGFRRI